jgi:hypothetical protein
LVPRWLNPRSGLEMTELRAAGVSPPSPPKGRHSARSAKAVIPREAKRSRGIHPTGRATRNPERRVSARNGLGS